MNFREWLLLAVGLTVAAIPTIGRSAEPGTAPILRIETTMHSATVRRVVIDRANRRLISAGDDKTIRIWQLPNGRLMRVLRFPIGAGHEGRITGLALAPDGRMLAAGGWTGWEWDRKASIYLFDSESGELVRRIEDFPETIGDITFSDDGRYMAVGLTANGGLRVLRTSDYKQVAEDKEYGDKCLGLDFHPDGSLAAAGVDGFVRLYDPRFKLIGRKRVAPGKRPTTIRFSPDGTKLAVSFDDVPNVAVYSARDLTQLYVTDARGVADNTRMSDTSWSSDGRSLYGVGENVGHGQSAIYRWSDEGRGATQKFYAAGQRITDVRQLPGGGVAFSTEDPSIGIVSHEGKLIFSIGSSLADFRDSSGMFAVAPDGSAVRFSDGNKGSPAVTFSLAERSVIPSNAAAESAFVAPRRPATVRLTDWKDASHPKLNDQPLPLDDYEESHSYAVSPDERTLILGTEWAVRAYDRQGKPLWKTAALGVVWNVTVTEDAKSVVATISDGTVRWYRIEDGVEYLALFPHANRQDWIAWIPTGYYVSSNYGDQYVGWHINRGKAATPDFYRAVQFERILYRPDVVDASFHNRGLNPAPVRNLSAGAFDISQLASIAPPRIRLTAISASAAQAAAPGRANIKFVAESGALPMLDYAVFINNIPVTPAKERTLSGSEQSKMTREISLDLTGRENLVRIEVFNGRSLGLLETYIDLSDAPPPASPGDLYVLAIGVKRFANLKNADLDYTDTDAEEIAKTLQQHGARYFKRIFVKVITDKSQTAPKRAAVVDALKFLQPAEQRDTIVLFLASHGISDVAGNYYFLPTDATQEDVVSVIQSSTPPPAPSLISWTSFFDSLRKTAGRRVVIVDTCQARNMEGKLDLHSLAKRSASSKFALVVASKGNEESQEYARGKHGLFTYALLQSLNGDGDLNKDKLITLSEAFKASLPIVERLRDRKQAGPQTPQLLAPEPLDTTVLSSLRQQ